MDEATPDWGRIEALVTRLVTGLHAAHPAGFDRVVGVARGGLVPAALLAQVAGIKQLESIQVLLYEGTVKHDAPRFLGGRPAAAGPSGDPGRTLIVDEILDTGETIEALAALYPDAVYAVLLGRHARERGTTAYDLLRVPTSEAGPDVWVADTVAGDAWVLFPWSPAEDRGGAEA